MAVVMNETFGNWAKAEIWWLNLESSS